MSDWFDFVRVFVPPHRDWSTHYGDVARLMNCVMLPTIRLNSKKPYIWLRMNSSSASVSSRRSVLLSSSDSSEYVIGWRLRYSVNGIFLPPVNCTITSKYLSQSNQRVSFALYCLLAWLRFNNGCIV